MERGNIKAILKAVDIQLRMIEEDSCSPILADNIAAVREEIFRIRVCL